MSHFRVGRRIAYIKILIECFTLKHFMSQQPIFFIILYIGMQLEQHIGIVQEFLKN